MTPERRVPVADGGSFRDSTNRVFRAGSRIVRGMRAEAGAQYRRIAAEPFFQALARRGAIVATRELAPDDADARALAALGWSAAFEHEPVSFISYPYEWSFSMLRDAALLQLEIVEACLEHGWTLKDATPYNVQWFGARPRFIDIGSFEPRAEGEPWVGYRQFCSLFLIPLMLKAHLGIDFAPLLRSRLDGIPPVEAARYFRGLSRFKAGVLSHVWFPAMVERVIARRERDRRPARRRAGGRQSKAMVVGLVQSLKRTTRRLRWKVRHTEWSQYAGTHSYDEQDMAAKLEFVKRHASSRHWGRIWDVGCNMGTFSKLVAPYAEVVVALDGDHDAIEQLYRSEKAAGGSRVLPMVMDLANVSPDQGWAGRERRALEGRGAPDLVLCLALVHHMRVAANIPVPLLLDWLARLRSVVVIEFVDREDEMFKKLLVNKRIEYADYTRESFVAEAEARFGVRDRQTLKRGHRELFLLEPR